MRYNVVVSSQAAPAISGTLWAVPAGCVRWGVRCEPCTVGCSKLHTSIETACGLQRTRYSAVMGMEFLVKVST